MINDVVAMMKQQAPPEAILKMLMEKYKLSREEAMGIIRKVASQLQQKQDGGQQGPQERHAPEQEKESKISPEQALQALEQAQVPGEHVLLMIGLYTQMSLNDIGKLASAVQAGMQEGGNEQQGQPQGPPQQSENSLDI